MACRSLLRMVLVVLPGVAVGSGCTDPSAPSAGSVIAQVDDHTSAASPDAVAAAAAPADGFGVLWSTERLRESLQAADLRILDVRARNAYDVLHIPGAVHVDVDAWREQALAKGGLHDAQKWATLVSQAAIDDATNVVVYGDALPDTARVWWTLKYLGVDKVAVLDGGWQAWLMNGETSTAVPSLKPVEFVPEFQTERLAELDELKQAYASDELTIIDTRSDAETAQGHIPGAVHLEWLQLVNDDGTFKSAAELQLLFSEHGVDPEEPTVTYCRSGGRAAVEALALELAGHKHVKNYYCSWQEWSSDPDAPVDKVSSEE